MINLLLYRLGQFLAMVLPLRSAYFIAGLISNLQYLVSRKDRLTVRNNIKAIFPDLDNKTLQIYSHGVFINFGKYLVDFFRFSKIDQAYVEEYVKVEGRENLDAALAKGKGVITLTAHIGNWELGGVVMAALGYPVAVVALPHNYYRVNNFFNRQRQNKGIKVIQLGRAARHCLEALQKNSILGLVGDRDFTLGGLNLEFFGKESIIPKGPAVLSLKTGATIVCGFMIREKNDHFRLVFEKPMEVNHSGNEEKDILALIEEYLSIIENYVKRYPEQWYMFRKFWFDNPS